MLCLARLGPDLLEDAPFGQALSSFLSCTLKEPRLGLRLFSLCLSACLVAACGGGSDQTPSASTPPVIALAVDALTLDESARATFTVSARDYLSTVIPTELSCDRGALLGTVLTPPDVTVPTSVTCTATATDSSSRRSTQTVTLTINPVTPVLALANGALEAAAAAVTRFDIAFARVPEGLVDATVNGRPVKLGVTPENQLVYLPRLGDIGNQTLVLELEGKRVSISFPVAPPPSLAGGTATYLDNYLMSMQQKVDAQIARARARGLAPDEIDKLTAARNSFDRAAVSRLSALELDFLAHVIAQNFSVIFPEDSPAGTANTQRFPSASPLSVVNLSACERAAVRIVAASGLTYISTLAVTGLAASGVGLPVATLTVLAAAVSWNYLNDNLDRFDELCYQWAATQLDGLTTAMLGRQSILSANRPPAALSQPLFSTSSTEGKVDFFHEGVKTFKPVRQYRVLVGADAYVSNVVATVNRLRGVVSTLVSLIGASNTPDFILAFANRPLNVNDFLTRLIDPAVLTLSDVSSNEVTGTLSQQGANIGLRFAIRDLNLGSVPFQFALNDVTVSNGRTVVNAEVSLNPPIAADLTFSARPGQTLAGQLQADFETRFELRSQPSLGTVSMPAPNDQAGLFEFRFDGEMDQPTTVSFQYAARNGSRINNGQSNVATVTIQIDGGPDPLTNIRDLIVGTAWFVGREPWTLIEYRPRDSVSFRVCCFGGSRSANTWTFFAPDENGVVFGQSRSGFNGFILSFRLLSIGASGFSVELLNGTGQIWTFPMS